MANKFFIIFIIILLICVLFLNIRTAVECSESYRDFYQQYEGSKNFLDTGKIYKAGIRDNNHTPLASLLGVPFSQLGYSQAAIIFSIFSLICTVLMFVIVAPLVPFSNNLKVLFGIALLFLEFNQSSICLANISGVVSLLIILSWKFLKQNQDVIAGFSAAIATHLKLYPALIFFYFLAARKYKAAFSMAVTFLLILSLLVMSLGIDQIVHCFTEIVPANSAFHRDYFSNISVNSQLEKLFGQPSVWIKSIYPNKAVLLISKLVVFCTILSMCIFSHIELFRNPTKVKLDLVFSVNLLTMMLVSPLTWGHYLLVLVLPLALLARKCENFRDKSAFYLLVFTLFLWLSLSVIKPDESMIRQSAPVSIWIIWPHILVTLNLIALLYWFHHQIKITVNHEYYKTNNN